VKAENGQRGSKYGWWRLNIALNMGGWKLETIWGTKKIRTLRKIYFKKENRVKENIGMIVKSEFGEGKVEDRFMWFFVFYEVDEGCVSMKKLMV
jgi:hypothetical protein